MSNKFFKPLKNMAMTGLALAAGLFSGCSNTTYESPYQINPTGAQVKNSASDGATLIQPGQMVVFAVSAWDQGARRGDLYSGGYGANSIERNGHFEGLYPRSTTIQHPLVPFINEKTGDVNAILFLNNANYLNQSLYPEVYSTNEAPKAFGLNPAKIGGKCVLITDTAVVQQLMQANETLDFIREQQRQAEYVQSFERLGDVQNNSVYLVEPRQIYQTAAINIQIYGDRSGLGRSTVYLNPVNEDSRDLRAIRNTPGSNLIAQTGVTTVYDMVFERVGKAKTAEQAVSMAEYAEAVALMAAQAQGKPIPRFQTNEPGQLEYEEQPLPKGSENVFEMIRKQARQAAKGK